MGPSKEKWDHPVASGDGGCFLAVFLFPDGCSVTYTLFTCRWDYTQCANNLVKFKLHYLII